MEEYYMRLCSGLMVRKIDFLKPQPVFGQLDSDSKHHESQTSCWLIINMQYIQCTKNNLANKISPQKCLFLA